MSVSDLLLPNFWDLNCRDLTLSGDLAIEGDMVLDDLHVTSTTNSTSTSTGAIVVDGGVGIAKSVVVGNTLSTPNLSMTNTTTIVGVTMYLVGGQNLGTISMSFVMLTTGTFAFIILNEFTTSAMSTNGVYIASTAGDIPAAFRPSTDYYAPITIIQNSSRVTGMIEISSAGQLFIYGSYVASQVNGYSRVSVLYSLL